MPSPPSLSPRVEHLIELATWKLWEFQARHYTTQFLVLNLTASLHFAIADYHVDTSFANVRFTAMTHKTSQPSSHNRSAAANELHLDESLPRPI